MKKVLYGGLSLLVLSLALIAVPTKASVLPNWNTTGSYVLKFNYNNTDYAHGVTFTQDGSGNLTGNGQYPATGTPQYTWVITSGSVQGDTVDFTANYTSGVDAVTPPTTMHVTGTIISGGTMSGTWSDNFQGGNRTGTWTSTSGNAIQIVYPPVVTVTPVAGSVLHGTEVFTITITDNNSLDSSKNTNVLVYLYNSGGTQKSKGMGVNLSTGTGTFTVDTTQLDNGDAWLDVGIVSDAAGNPSGKIDNYFKNYTIENNSTGSIEITKYDCPTDTVVTRALNGVGGLTPSGCTPSSGKTFGYVHGTQTDALSPFPEVNSPLTAGGTTDSNGVLTIQNLDTSGRYLIEETNGSNQRLPDASIIGLYCTGDGDTSGTNDNQELTFVPANGVTKCVAYDPVTSSVTTNAANPIGTTTATVNGTNGGVAAGNTSFWWGTTPLTGTLTPGTNPGATEFPATNWSHDNGIGAAGINGTFNENLTGLPPNTTYNFVAWVLVSGTWYPGQVLSFTTGNGATPTVITNAATLVTDTTATMNGTDGAVAGDNTSFWWGTTPISGTLVSGTNPASTSEFPAGWNHDNGLGSVSANGTFSEPLTGLTTGTEYYFVAWVKVAGIWYPDSVLNFTTKTSQSCNTNATQAIISDTTDTFSGPDGSGNASIVAPTTITKTSWTASIPNASWIWSKVAVTDGTVANTETFTKTFTIVGTPKDSSLQIAADNRYSVSINGHNIDAGAGTASGNNYSSVAIYAVPATDLLSGANSMVVIVTNDALNDSNPTNNPAGLIYSLTVNNNECVTPEPVTTYTLTYTAGANGTISGTATQTGIASGGSGTAVIAVPNSGFHFVNWSDNSSTNPSRTDTNITSNITTTATFAADENNNGGGGNGGSGGDSGNNNNNVVINNYGGSHGHPDGGNGDGGNGGHGSVLGAETGPSCGIYIDKYVKLGTNNDSATVKELQTFLNTELNINLTVSGTYDLATFNAVKTFQEKYPDQILTPWGLKSGTGYVYKTTQRWINMILCPSLDLLMPTLN